MQENKNKKAIHRVNVLSKDLDSLYHQAALKLGISDSVMYILYVIYENGDSCLLHDICNACGISKQTINSALRKLEAEEILYLEPYKGKTKRVCLTEKGKIYVTQTAARLYQAECQAFDSWTQEEIEQYVKLMEKFQQTLRIQIEEM